MLVEYEHEYEYILSIFSGLRGERGDFENDSMRETPLWRRCQDVKIMTAMVSTITMMTTFMKEKCQTDEYLSDVMCPPQDKSCCRPRLRTIA